MPPRRFPKPCPKRLQQAWEKYGAPAGRTRARASVSRGRLGRRAASYYSAMETLSSQLLQIFALALGLEPQCAPPQRARPFVGMAMHALHTRSRSRTRARARTHTGRACGSWFEDKIDKHRSALRCLNYPDQVGTPVHPPSCRHVCTRSAH
jgi:hypothetical protein